MPPLFHNHRRPAFLFLVLLVIGALLGMRALPATTQGSDELTTLTRQAFNEVSKVYELGGQSPDLVARLNIALELIEQARLLRLQGDQTGAARLEEEARGIVSEVISAVPEAREKAESESRARVLGVLVLIPVVVALCTFIFIAGLRTWRLYEKAKLFEMRIVEKKKVD